MKKFLFAFILLLGAQSAATQETYTLNASAPQVSRLNVVVNSVNDRTCINFNQASGCTQAQACTAAGISSSCTAAQARTANARIFPLTQAGREEYITFNLVATQVQSYFEATIDYNHNKYCTWFRAQTVTVKNAECSKSGAPTDCELCR